MILKGTIASNNKKKIIGIVSIILDVNINNFKKGEILVTKSTNPNFLPLMTQAKAIITETGGLLSHAAIVSREFGIPCIVGVKDITKKLKTGDKIELDLINATIKIIK